VSRYCAGMMSKENAVLARSLVDAWNRRDLEAIVALCDQEAEWINSPTAVEPGTRRGVQEVAAVFRAQWEVLLDASQEIEQLYDRGDEIIVLTRISRRVRPESEARLEDRALSSMVFRDGKVTRTEILGFGSTEVEEALKAAGLEE
jgi:ketosteroid isomerase-like protein